MKSSLYYIPARARLIILKLSEALVSEPEGLVIRNKETDLINRCEILLREFPSFNRFAFILGMYLFDLLPLFFGFGLARFALMNLERRKAYVDKWMTTQNPFKREFFKGLRGLLMMCYFSHPDIWEYIDYRPRDHVAERIALREKIQQS